MCDAVLSAAAACIGCRKKMETDKLWSRDWLTARVKQAEIVPKDLTAWIPQLLSYVHLLKFVYCVLNVLKKTDSFMRDSVSIDEKLYSVIP
jgi:hypothetical protein